MSKAASSFDSQEECSEYHRLQQQLLRASGAAANGSYIEGLWCPASYDEFLCWPPSPPSTQSLPCPAIKGADPSKQAQRECQDGGRWNSVTQYQICIIPELQGVMDDLHSNSPEDALFKLEIARVSRVIEMVGLVISLLAIIISVLIFCYFRSLRNNRTRMHLNLFGAMLIQITVRLTLYIDQYVTRSSDGQQQGIDNTAMLCESFYILLEYARTAMFLWMFIEGHYLHSMLTITVFSDRPNFIFYYVLGWGLPVVMTAVWAAVTVTQHSSTQCMWGYSLSSYFWILEGPRLAIILTNLLFLLNILRVLITKLKASVSNETQQVKKAVRAAIVLLPLLGITNSLQMVTSLLDQRAWTFAAWSYFTTILTSFQGFFVALIYCFLNQEVRVTLKKFFKNYSHSRSLAKSSRRFSMSTNVQSEAIPMTVPVRASVLAVICEDSSEKDATPVNVPLMSTLPDSPPEKESFANATSPKTYGELTNIKTNQEIQSPESIITNFKSDCNDVRHANLTHGQTQNAAGSPNVVDKVGKMFSLPRNGKINYPNPIVSAYRSLENISNPCDFVSFNTDAERGQILKTTNPFSATNKNIQGEESIIDELAGKPLADKFSNSRGAELFLSDSAICEDILIPSSTPGRDFPQSHINDTESKSPVAPQMDNYRQFPDFNVSGNFQSIELEAVGQTANFPMKQQSDYGGNSLSTSDLSSPAPVVQCRNGLRKVGLTTGHDFNATSTDPL